MRTLLAAAVLLHSFSPLRSSEKPDFARDVWPILSQKCVRCHGPKRQESGLRLDIRTRTFAGGDSGAVIVPGFSAKSEFMHRLTGAGDRKRMPPSGKPLADTDIAILKSWIDAGAVWPDELAGKDAKATHWAFQPVRQPATPDVRNAGWSRDPIDRFILARLEQKKIDPAPEADRRTLIRRLHLDLVGLPPTPEEVNTFTHDDRPDAYEQLVERLLASPHFGERWGRHWLDLVRFAESDGYENDNLRPDAWRYRDWVVKALNRDMAFTRFTIEQLAGDLQSVVTIEERIATGMHRNTLYNSAASGDKEEFRTYAIKDRTDTTATVWMGLTLGCAKCHSHRYDPISQREYYQLYAFFNRTDNHDVAVAGGKVMALKAAARTTHIHLRGNFLNKGDEVTPATPAFLPPIKPRGMSLDRLDLANWLLDPAHPLTARVAANRMWQLLFGRGLVPTPENFGTNGSPPTHSELLDWLSSEFVEGQWSQKRLIRMIVLSSAYRQSSRVRSELADSNNALVARQDRIRLEGEIVRDLALSASGLLDSKLGGPSIVPPFPRELPVGQFTAESLKKQTPERHRRSIYIHVQRTLVHPVLSPFGPADPNQPCVRRERSGTPMQALSLLNDPTFIECAQSLARRLIRSRTDRGGRIELGFRLCLGREPEAAEKAILLDLVEKQEQLKANEETVWTGVARTLLNLEPFTTRE